MTKSFRHKGLLLLCEEAKSNKLPVKHITRMLVVMDSAQYVPKDDVV